MNNVFQRNTLELRHYVMLINSSKAQLCYLEERELEFLELPEVLDYEPEGIETKFGVAGWMTPIAYIGRVL
jgi:hypothetical protein